MRNQQNLAGRRLAIVALMVMVWPQVQNIGWIFFMKRLGRCGAMAVLQNEEDDGKGGKQRKTSAR